MASPGERFVLLGLRLGRHVDGLVDSYCGPADLKAQVDAEPLVDPAELVADGDALLDGLEDGWLADQALGLRTYAGVLAGEGLGYSDEVERCYGVRPERRGTADYEVTHEQLEQLLPGTGSLSERYQAWRRSNTMPAELVIPALDAVVGELRSATSRVVDLPAGEELVTEAVRDEPWWAFNYYQGDLRSRVVVNLDVPTTANDVVHLAGHEVYPGHHTERTVKEQLLVRDQGDLAESIQMVPTPAALVSEGIAEAGPLLVWNEELSVRVVEALRTCGVDYDVERSRAIAAARLPLRRVGVDVALMIHEDGASREEGEAYYRRWSLIEPKDAAHSVDFIVDPTWRSYVITYAAGRELVGAWAGGDPGRLARLLTEHVRVGDLL